MTAYAPPSYSYFSGLQFNPNINEQTKTSIGQRLYGGLVSIIGTISTIITTPLFQIIQGATTTLNMIEASTDFINTSYFKIQAPNIYLSPLGTWWGVSSTSTVTSLYNPTLVEMYSDTQCIIYAPTVSMKLAGTNTSDGFNFCTNTSDASITTSSIVATGGTTANTGTLTLTAGTAAITGTTTNLSATTTTVSGTTTNLSATTTNIGVAGGQTNLACATTLSSSDGTFFLNTGASNFLAFPSTTYTLPVGNASVFNQVWYTPYATAAGTTYTITFPTTTSTPIRDGCVFYIWNSGLGPIVCNVSGANFFGASLTRGGVSTLTIATNTGRMFRQSVYPNGFNSTGSNRGYLVTVM